MMTTGKSIARPDTSFLEVPLPPAAVLMAIGAIFVIRFT